MNKQVLTAVALASIVVLLSAGNALAADAASQAAGSADPASPTGSLLRQAYAGQVAVADWPQWRGPTRDGVVPAGPKLLDTWPKDGPKLLWKSDAIPSGKSGGSSSVVVSGGRHVDDVEHTIHRGLP